MKTLVRWAEETHEQGREEKVVEIVKKALLLSMPTESIVAFTNMNVADVMRVPKEMALVQS